MSTKIFNAYKWCSTIQELRSMLKELRELYKQDCVDFLKNLKSNSSKTSNQPINIFKLVKELKEAIDLGYNTPNNLGASIVVYIAKNGDLYIQFFGVIDRYRLKFCTDYVAGLESLGVLKDAHYQNQVDSEYEGITDEHEIEIEDARRRALWDELLPSGVPDVDGLFCNLSDSDTLYNIATGVANS